jgi:hypothetical protein
VAPEATEPDVVVVNPFSADGKKFVLRDATEVLIVYSFLFSFWFPFLSLYLSFYQAANYVV